MQILAKTAIRPRLVSVLLIYNAPPSVDLSNQTNLHIQNTSQFGQNGRFLFASLSLVSNKTIVYLVKHHAEHGGFFSSY
jgi:hypothetical protein